MEDKELVEIRKFVKKLIDNGRKPQSIANVIQSTNTSKIRNQTFGKGIGKKIINAYTYNYNTWLKTNGEKIF